MSNKNSYRRKILSMLKCIRCGSIKKLYAYTHKETMITNFKSTRRYYSQESMTWTHEFPVCSKCLEEFKIWKKKNQVFNVIFGLLFISLWIFIILNILNFMTESFSDNPNYFPRISVALIEILPFLILLIITNYFSKKYKKKKENLSNYIDIKLGYPKIRPEKSKTWYPFKEWAESVIKSRLIEGTIDPSKVLKFSNKMQPNNSKLDTFENINTIYTKCPNCGNIMNLTISKICEVCGYKF